MAKKHTIRNLVCFGLSALTVGVGINVASRFITVKDKNPYDGNSISDYNADYNGSYGMLDEIEIDNGFDELKDELDGVLSNIDIDDISRSQLINAFEDVYNNYDSLYNVIKQNGMDMSKEEYIRSRINLLKDVKTITATPYNNESTNSMAYNAGDYIYINPDLDRFDASTSIIHELEHSTEHIETTNYDLLYLFTEGQAVFEEQFCYDTCKVNSLYLLNGSQGELYSVRGLNKNSLSYILYGKCFGTLACLVDSNVIEEAKKSCDSRILEDYINSNYSVDGKEFMDCLVSIVKDARNDDCYSENITNNIVNLEKMVNCCFNDKLDKIDNENELNDFINLKSYYNKQFATKELENYQNDYSFNIKKDSSLDSFGVDNKLFNKCVDYDVLGFIDEENSRDLFNLMIGNNSCYYSNYSYNEYRTVTDKNYSSKNDVLTVLDGEEVIMQYNTNSGMSKKDKTEFDYSSVGNIKSIMNNAYSKQM